MNESGTTRAVFLDRDWTLIEDPGYLRDPEQVRLLDGAAESVRRLRNAGYAIIVVTNQSGIARGLITEEELAAVHQRLELALANAGARLDAIYHCPYLDGPEAVREEYRRASDLRKPLPGMLTLAAREHGLDLNRSWMVGDSARDIEAGRAAGCRTVLIRRAEAEPTDAEYAATDLPQAVEYIVAHSNPAPPKRFAAASHESPPPEPPQGEEAQRSADVPAARAALEQILDQIKMARREQRHEDFSIAKLAGAVAQAFALFAIGSGIYAWLDAGNRPDGATTATVRLLAGIALQLMALTFFVAAKRR